MAYITKRGNSYSVRYTYEDEHGKSCDKWESFPTKEEATNRKKQIEHELAAGTFLIPSSVTVAEFLMDWLPKQCSKHKWAPKTYESNLSTIQNLIIPYIGGMEMQKLKPYHMENLYTTLSKTPCGSYIEGKKQELTEKQKQRFLSGTTIHEVHRLLGTAFQYAVEWGILVKSPVPVDSPKKSTQERTIWTVEEMRAALDSMEDPVLHLAVHLTLVGALREGEIVGLTPEDLDFDAADGIGTFLIPSTVTVGEFLMDWLPKQCSKHKWAPKTYESNLSTIQNLIIPYIGSMEMQKLKPYHMENLYTTLSKTPCGSYIEGKKQELTEKQKQRFLSGTTIHEVHRLLGTAFQYAVEWGILVKSPVPVDSPKKSTQERTIWTVEEMRTALDSMEDPILHLAVHLTLVGALREGEIVGLTPEDIDFDAADGIGTFRINKSMQRVRKEALKQVDDGCIIKVFPDKLERSTTSLILKSTKTASSCRTIFMTSALKEELKKWLNQLAADERKDPTRYHDSGMLFRLPNGLAVEPVLIRKKFLKWQDAHPEFPRIVFHGLRHSSATYQLMISGGDVKAVQ